MTQKIKIILSLSLLVTFFVPNFVLGALTFTNDDITSNEDITITGVADAASSIYLHANGGTSETIKIHADQGTSTQSINLMSDLGGIQLQSGINAGNAIYLHANGGVDETITIYSGLGQNYNSIHIVSEEGGISINAGNDVRITAADRIDLYSTGSEAITIGDDDDNVVLEAHQATGSVKIISSLVTFDANAPTASQSAGTPTIDIDSSNTVGRVVTDTTAHTTVTITFTRAFQSPVCTFSAGDAEAAAIMGSVTGAYGSATTTAFTITHAADSTSATWLYQCFDRFTQGE